MLLRLAPAALLHALVSREALAEPGRSAAVQGLAAMGELALALRRGELEPLAWQDEMARLVAEIDLAEVIAAIDLDGLVAALDPLPEDRPRVQPLHLVALESVLAEAGAKTKLFALAPGVAIVPHGHHGLVSMHWVLRGALHGRSFDRLERTPRHVVMRPTIDRVLRPGAATSVSEHRDNIHWFVAVEGPAFALDVLLSGLDSEGPRGRFYVDPRAAEPDGGERLRAPILSHAQAQARYGRG
jgi:PCO_ADO